VLACARIAGQACYILRTDQKHESAVPIDYVERVNRAIEFERVLSSQEGGHRFTTLPAGQNPDGFGVQLRDLPARTVAYIRVLDPYREGVAQAACERLLAWAIERGLADGQWLGYMWEEPEIVALKDCRYDVALVVDDVETAGELYKTWLPRSGFVPDDQPAFEAWIGRPFAHGNEHFTIACQLPLKPA